MTTAVLDACFLYSASLRDLWMNLAVQFVFQPKWTALIQDEWMRSVLENRPDLRPEQFDRTKVLIERWGRDWGAGVRAAHPQSQATGSEGPPCARRCYHPHGIRALHPDFFVSELLEEDPEGFLRAIRTQRASLKNPPKSPAEFLETLRSVGLPNTVSKLRDYEL